MANDEQLNEFLILLCRSLSTRKLYFAGHVKVKEQSQEIVRHLHAYFSGSSEEELFIGSVEGSLVYKGLKLTGPSIIGAKLIAFADNLRCGGFTFNRATSAEDIELFLDLSAALSKPLNSLEEARKLVRSKGISAITLGYHYVKPSELVSRDKKYAWMGQEASSYLSSPALIYQALFDVVSGAYDNAANGQAIDIHGAQSVSEYLLHHTRTHFCDMMQEIHYPDFDAYTVGHSVRVAALAVFTGATLGLDDKMLLQTGTAALLHDVGKAKIPGSIIHKQGKLTAEEYETMKSHPALGVDILLAHNNTTYLDRAATWGHHIRYDGKGYPELPTWAFRHPVTALLQVCDVFEALTSARPYKRPKSPQEAYSIMIGDKGAFHPGILAQFVRALGLYPPGNRVLLSDGRKGKVMTAGKQIDRPSILVTNAKDGTPLNSDQASLCDLGDPKFASVRVKELLLDN